MISSFDKKNLPTFYPYISYTVKTFISSATLIAFLSPLYGFQMGSAAACKPQGNQPFIISKVSYKSIPDQPSN